MTFDRATVQKMLDETVLRLIGERTAIGDAIALTAKRFADRPQTNKILILVTDGQNTAGNVSPAQALELAKYYDVKIYTIGVGAEEIVVDGFFGQRRVNPSRDLDENMLRQLADETGGEYFRARSTEELERIYTELDTYEPVQGENQLRRPQTALYHWPLGSRDYASACDAHKRLDAIGGSMADFHFLRPWWLLTLIPVVIITWWAWRHAHEKQGWSKIIPAHLQAILLPRNGQRSGRFQLMLVGLALSCSALALAGPAWQKLPQPVYQLKAGSVVVMDMSLSVYSTDLPPNRLSQMRFKATDLVTEHIDGDIGLIAYAGDAFTISPLTADGSNLTNLIRALSPDIMPTPGSYPVRALELADQLLKEAGYPEGDIYWLTDGIDSRDQTDIGDFINRTAHRLNILAVGTEAGAPIQLPDGRLLRDSSDNVVIPKLSVGGLPALAERSGGRFIQIRADQQDIVYLTSQAPTTRDGDKSSMQAGDQWADQGPWLIPLILLLLLPLARRGRLLSMAPVLFVIALSHPVHAAQQEPLAWHEKLWQTPYQQADQP